ncbi:MAG TPA: TIGR03557 family F420-dependent LLM class oxidoreductase [Actinomycetota bacterium]|nr:TIGR03557 family F420-dependent LLM class oxidoreductase [Actinomycetota bacterium]
MVAIGYKLASEEHDGKKLVRLAQEAERVGFSFALISDHFHPWINKQGHSPFVWTVLGGIAEATDKIEVGTSVTCPTMRTHPAVIAQAAATTAQMFDGRFFFGVGSGENLNEHIIGAHWPETDVRLEMLEEAVEVIRELWKGKQTSHYGKHYTVENARIYTLPDTPPPILVAAAGPKAATLAGRIGDGYVGTSPEKKVIEKFRAAGGGGKPTYGELGCCWAPTLDEAEHIVHEWWPNAGLKGELTQELKTPAHFEQAAENVKAEELSSSMPCGPDASKYLDAIKSYADAGYDHVGLHQIGPDQEGFFKFFESELLPELSKG